MPGPRLLAITDRARMGADPLATATRLMERLGPRVLISVRERDLSARALYRWAEVLLARAEDTGSIVLLSDRADVVRCFSPRLGLQLPERGLTLDDARQILGHETPVACSVHSAESAAARAAEGAELVVLAPVFATPSKPDTIAGAAPVLGLEGLRRAVAAVGGRAPLFALGGIDARSAGSVLACGVDGVAAIRAAWSGELERLFG